MKKFEIPREVFEDAVERAQGLMVEAVEKSKDLDDFNTRFAHLQIMASHLLASIVFNSFVQSEEPDASLNEHLNKAFAGIRKEISWLADAYASGDMEESVADYEKDDN